MSGGFFRGTSADQDTRFSNKQAKLMKSQKFAPELEHLVDMTKVNMEVIKPWITRRVTELLGFEDEVLINFIHGLLDAKEVNGKEVQIQITGFMEKNTGKFMKELWTLLLSAQKNASGVPQQFLDAKEEELLKKKAENDRITSEIQRKKDKEGREIMEERLKKLDGGFDSKDNDTASDPALKPRDSGYYDWDGKETDKRNGARARSRLSRSPHSPAVSTSPHRGSPSRSMSKSFSNSQSYSGGRHRSRSISRSLEARGRSLSFERIRRSPRRRSISPHRRSPRHSPHRRLPYSRRRSRSRSSYRSPSLVRRRMHSPVHRSSPSFRRRRSPSPVRRRRSPSPVRRRRSPSLVRRRRSPSPVRRHRSPSLVRRRRSPSPRHWHKSPSPGRRHRSPPWRRHRSPSPLGRQRSLSPRRRRSPVSRHRSPSPVRRIPPTNVRHRSDSPLQSPSPIRRRYGSRTPPHSPPPLQRRSPISGKKRSPSMSPQRSPRDEWSSQSPIRHISPSPIRKNSPGHQRIPVQSSVGRVRTQERLSSETHEPSSPLGSVRRDKSGKASHYKSQDSMSTPEKSPTRSVSPEARSETSSEGRSPHESPMKQRRERLSNERSLSPLKKQRTQKPRHGSPETREEAEAAYYSRESRDPKMNSSQKISKHSPVSKRKGSPAKYRHEDEFSPERVAGHPTSEYHHYDNNDWNKKGREIKRDKSSGKGNESPSQQKSSMNKVTFSREKPHEAYAVDIKKPDDKDQSHSNYAKSSDRHHKSEATQDLVGKVDRVNQSASYDSVSEESGKHRREGKDRRKHKRSEKKYVSSDEDYSDDSEVEDRKEAKRRRKEEKKLRKEEKRRRREERRHRREERRAEKLKMKSKADYTSDEERMDDHQSDSEETPSEQKKLEIELRNKALESLKAKRGMNN
ncbi:Serine/arginine repetitive matrix protein 1 [Spatholobus suberectus]|nr:Serine/arginine repetitive matrix protein 1 [Spatholobus suberectus]